MASVVIAVAEFSEKKAESKLWVKEIMCLVYTTEMDLNVCIHINIEVFAKVRVISECYVIFV